MEPTIDTTVETTAGGGPMGAIMGIIMLVIGIVVLIGTWKMFTKAGKPGIACIIPIWNAIAFLQIGGKPAWWVILLLVPVVDIVIVILACIGVAKNFGKGGGFAVGLLLLPMIFMPVLGFGSAQYGAAAAAPAGAPAAE